MPTQKKIEAVEELTDILARSTVVISAEYRGLRVADSTALRRQLGESGIEMHVVKNTLFRIAAERAGKSAMQALAEGPTALIVGFGDPVAPVKTIVEYQRTARNSFAARNAYVDGQLVPANRLNDIATLPSKDAMIAEFVGLLESPLSTLVGLLSGTIQEFSGLLGARVDQMEGSAA